MSNWSRSKQTTHTYISNLTWNLPLSYGLERITRSSSRIGGSAKYRGFPGLVITARAKHPVPSRTRPLSAVAPMVLRLKTWESRSSPNLKSPENTYLSKR
uniref:Uncharacterized protein n=1 Tax=uncultured Rhodobacterales bacterium HF4000_03E16 TaxID=710785 RepID=E0XV84_9RHOB|nr:hypothetical protein [uncultured Rhodobacterales bacterium HF4000_03E16]